MPEEQDKCRRAVLVMPVASFLLCVTQDAWQQTTRMPQALLQLQQQS